MERSPWWIDEVRGLLAPGLRPDADLATLWRLWERLEGVRDSVDRALLLEDFREIPTARERWDGFERRCAEVEAAMRAQVEALAQRLRSGQLPPAAFRRYWHGLGFVPHTGAGAGTPADDFLDGMLHLARLSTAEARPPSGTVNLSSRAQRIADFLSATEPTDGDVVVDIGSGSGKFAITVAASTSAEIVGVEFGASYVEAARASAGFFGLSNVRFIHGDARAVDLSEGNIFYVYHPFHGEVARAVSETLGALARRKDIRLYVAGPRYAFAEHFVSLVDRGSLRLVEERGEFSDVLLLRSLPGHRP